MDIKIDLSDFEKTLKNIEADYKEKMKINTKEGVGVKSFQDLISLSAWISDKFNTNIILEDYNGNRCELRKARLEKFNGKTYLVLK